MARKKIGFRFAWEKDVPETSVTDVECASVPEELTVLRGRVAALAVLIISTKYVRMRQPRRLKILMEFVDLNNVESRMTKMVEGEGRDED